MSSIRMYLIARISEDAHLWNKKVCDVLQPPIEVFLPHEHNPYNIQHHKLPKEVYDVDLAAMKNADMALALPEFGSDCSYEVGWFSHSPKPTIFFVDTQLEWLRNWMVKGGLDYVVTTNAAAYEILKKDPILSRKEVIHIDALTELNEVVQDIYTSIHRFSLSVSFASYAKKVQSQGDLNRDWPFGDAQTL